MIQDQVLNRSLLGLHSNILPERRIKTVSELTFSNQTLTAGLSVQRSSVVLRNTKQSPHEVGELLCTQTASVLFVKQLKDQSENVQNTFIKPQFD